MLTIGGAAGKTLGRLIGSLPVPKRLLAACTTILVLAAVGLAEAATQQPGNSESEGQELSRLFEDFFEEFLELNPTFATSIGDNRFNDRLTIDIGVEHRRRLRGLFERFLAASRSVQRERLTSQQRLRFDSFRNRLLLELEGLGYDDHLFPILPTFSLPVLFPEMGSGEGVHPFLEVKDYEDFLSRMEGFEVWIDTAIANLNEGLDAGVTEPRILIERTLHQLRAQYTCGVENSHFYHPILNLPDHFSSEDQQRLAMLYRQVIADRVMPAYRKLHDFLSAEYLPASRSTISASALPWGRDWYRYLVRFYTSTELQPAEIYELGLSEIETITREMEKVKRRTGFAGDLQSFRRQVASDIRNYYTRSEDVLEAYAGIRSRVTTRLPELFSRLPELDFEVLPVPQHRARFGPGAYYESPKPDGSRPGVFFVNTSTRYYPRLTMEALFLHEALPGHHLQISLAREDEDLPSFVRFGYYPAFSEGWALYCESLGKRLGLYRNPLKELGRLAFDLGRASRLVADVGIHELGWTQQQAEKFLSDRHLTWAVGEIGRYTEMPGQGLAYKVGERKILELRSRAEKTLKRRFDLRRFHDALLADGPMPLGLLEQKMVLWIETEKSSER